MTRNTLRFCIVLFVVTLCESINIDNSALFNQNVIYTNKYICSLPQPRISKSLDVVKQFINEETLRARDTLDPAYTVLYKCDEHCGICPPKQKCKADAASTEEVTFVYRIMNKKNQVKRYGHAVFQNATLCICVQEEK